MWLGFFRLRCASQANLSRFWCKLQGWAFYNSKSSIPNGSASGEAGHIPQDENPKAVISRPVNYLEIVEPFATIKCLETGQFPWDRRALCDRQVPRDHSVTSKSSSPLWASSTSRLSSTLRRARLLSRLSAHPQAMQTLPPSRLAAWKTASGRPAIWSLWGTLYLEHSQFILLGFWCWCSFLWPSLCP